jgi:hypothetical protein
MLDSVYLLSWVAKIDDFHLFLIDRAQRLYKFKISNSKSKILTKITSNDSKGWYCKSGFSIMSLISCLSLRLTRMEKTGGLMISIEHVQWRYFAFALFHNKVAPRGKPAACLGFKQTRNIAPNGEKWLFWTGFIGNRLQKTLGIRMLGIF